MVELSALATMMKVAQLHAGGADPRGNRGRRAEERGVARGTITIIHEKLTRTSWQDWTTDEEIARLEKIPVMEKVDDAAARELNMITTRVVLVWKKRQEK